MIKVLQVYRTFFPDTQGGLEEVIRQICLNTHSVQNRVLSISSSIKKPDIVNIDGIKIYRLPLSFEIASCSFAFKGLSVFKELVAWADIINYHFPWPYEDILHLLFVRGENKKTVITYHSDIIRQKSILRFYKPIMYQFLSSVNRIIASSPNYLLSSDILQKFNNKVDVIPYGIDEKSYPDIDISQKEYWEIKYPKPFFLFIGVLRYYKGLEIAIEAAKGADYQILIVGSGPIEGELKQQVKDMNIDNVEFLGYQNNIDKLALLSLCRGVIFPSYLRSEAFGMTLLEGAMFAKPLISAEIGSGMSYINQHEITGLHVIAKDIKSFREAMDKLYAHEDYAKQLGLAARERFEELFTGVKMGKKYDQLYLSLMKD